jgi:murein L,D-transpeptidase YcbB/YkuD
MSTVAPPLVWQLAEDWRSKCGLKSAKISGVIGNSKHAGGYHIGRRFQPASNYSCVRPDDKVGPDDAAAAIDMTMAPADMRICTARLVAAYSNLKDPRRKYLNAFNGTTDSRTARRFDVYARKSKSATSDHLWHVHLELRRKYVNSPKAMAAVLSILRGESVGAYLTAVSSSVLPTKTSSGGSAVTVPSFPGILRRNDKQSTPNASVRWVEEQLRRLGLYAGDVDGYFGPMLEAAVKVWQRRHGLDDDGIIGKKTWPTLGAAR